MWFEDEGSFSITFSSDGTGTVNEGSFSWSGSGPYTLTVDGESTTINLSGDSITYNFEYEDDVCIQFTLTK